MSAPTRPSRLHDFFLLFLLFCGGAGEAEVPPPQNVTMVTLNTHYVLSWEWEPSAAESHAVTFTMQYVGRHELKYKKNPKWITVCNQTAARSCDLTPFNLHYLGIFALRVRASVDGRHSDWEQLEFCPDKDAALGPPSSVALAPAGSDLDVVVTNPLSSHNTSMKLLIPDLYYRLEYWERPADGQASAHKLLRINTTMVTLPDLKAWTWYCVMVQTRYDYYGKFSDFTAPHCMQTEGPIPWWKIFLYFLGSLLFFFLFVLVVFYGSFRCCKTIKDLLNPSDQLPPHLKKYLCSAPSSDTPRLLTPNSESELLCKGVTVCPLPTIQEIHISPPEGLSAPPEGLDPNSRHSRQDSSSSGDSGVYSSGGSSAPQQLAYAGSEDGFKGSFDPERVNLLEMAAGLKSRPVVVDEGVVDVCV